MTSTEQKKTYPKNAQSRNERLKTALKLNLVKRKAQSRGKYKKHFQNKTSDEAIDTSKD